MRLDTGSHAPEEWLVRYAMRSLTEQESESLEDHLMFCQQCQDQLESVESFLLAARQASRQVRLETLESQARVSFWSRFTRFSMSSEPAGHRPRNWFALPITAAAMACLALFLIIPAAQDHNYQQVRMEAVRGTEVNAVDSRHPLEMAFSLAGLPQFPSYRIEVVSATGATSASSTVEPQGNTLTLRVKTKLPPGQYWVRIYAAGSAETLREFSLRSN